MSERKIHYNPIKLNVWNESQAAIGYSGALPYEMVVGYAVADIVRNAHFTNLYWKFSAGFNH